MPDATRFPREIRVYVRDERNHLIPDTRIEWFENGRPRGTVEHSEGHASFSPVQLESIVEVAVEYKGERQTRKLALEERVCTFVYADVSVLPTIPTPSAERATDRTMPAAAALWRNSVVLAGVITGVLTLVGVYWQFIYKPAAAEVQMAVFVQDAVTHRPVPGAEVTLQRANRREPRTADDQGTARFKIEKDLDKDITVSAHATGYQDATLAYDAPSRNDHIDLLLTPNPVQKTPLTPAKQPAPSVRVPNGTWQVVLSGNLALQRAGTGTFVFAPQPDGHVLLTANLLIDGAKTSLEGQAGNQNRLFFLTFTGKTDEGTWIGQGQLSIATNDRMSGYITDSSGAQIPLELKKP